VGGRVGRWGRIVFNGVGGWVTGVGVGGVAAVRGDEDGVLSVHGVAEVGAEKHAETVACTHRLAVQPDHDVLAQLKINK
jgi:hypothetical protein